MARYGGCLRSENRGCPSQGTHKGCPYRTGDADPLHTVRTCRGEAVRSKSEVIIANLLNDNGLDYRYEEPLTGSDGVVRYPDFTIDDAATGLKVYWEHLGMLGDPTYRTRWERKLAWYRTQGILPRAEGEGPAGTLVITSDDEQGGIDAAQLEQVVREVFGL